jgi:hypothetical protein
MREKDRRDDAFIFGISMKTGIDKLD